MQVQPPPNEIDMQLAARASSHSLANWVLSRQSNSAEVSKDNKLLREEKIEDTK